MQIVIDITPEAMDDIKNDRASRCFLQNKILNGKPLPKGHGDLIDRRKVLADMSSAWVTGGTRTVMQGYVARAETIIEADKDEDAEECVRNVEGIVVRKERCK